MDRQVITDAIKTRINSGGLGLSIAWENVDSDGATPYLMVSFPSAFRTGGTLRGGGPVREDGTVLAVAVTDAGGGTGAAEGYADAVAALFPEGLKITATGGEIVVMKPTDIRGGYQSGTAWHVPAVISYAAFDT